MTDPVAFDGLALTTRELEVCVVIREDGCRSLQAIASALDPPISRRTAEVHVANIAAKLPEEWEPRAPPFWRVVLYSRRQLG